MPANMEPTFLLQVFTCNRDQLGQDFVLYDSSYPDGVYELPAGKLLVLLLSSGDSTLWTTVRSWRPSKEIYYRGLIGQEVEIEIVEETKHEKSNP